MKGSLVTVVSVLGLLLMSTVLLDQVLVIHLLLGEPLLARDTVIPPQQHLSHRLWPKISLRASKTFCLKRKTGPETIMLHLFLKKKKKKMIWTLPQLSGGSSSSFPRTNELTSEVLTLLNHLLPPIQKKSLHPSLRIKSSSRSLSSIQKCFAKNNKVERSKSLISGFWVICLMMQKKTLKKKKINNKRKS